MKYQIYSYRDFEKILRKNGYVLKRQKGSHFIWNNGMRSLTVTHNCNPMIARRLINEYNLIV